MGKKYRINKQERDAERKAENLGLVGNGVIEVTTRFDPQPEEKEVVVEEPTIEEKDEKYYAMFGGATSFEEYDAYLTALDQASEIRDLTFTFRELVDNILYSDDIESENKASMITSLTNEYHTRLTTKKSFFEKVVDRVKGVFGHKEEEEQQTGALRLYKDKSGGWRWLGIFTNNFKDREGDIITSDAHKEFCSYLDKNPEKAPEFLVWHTPGSARKSRADLWDYDKGFFLISGKLTDEEAHSIKKCIDRYGDLGMSHGFLAVRDKENQNLITKYRSFEVSDLPLSKAANLWTDLTLVLKEASIMNEEKRNYLIEALGESAVSEIEASLDANKAALDAAEVESKETEEVPTEKVETPAETEEVAEEDGKELTPESEPIAHDALTKAIETVIVDVFKPDQLGAALKMFSERLDVVEAKIDKNNKTLEQKVAEELAPRVDFSWLERPSESKENIVSDEEVKKVVPNAEFAWLNESVSPII